MFDRMPDLGPVRIGLQRAALHWARAGYEVVAGVGALVEEVAAAIRDGGEDSEEAQEGPTKIEVE